MAESTPPRLSEQRLESLISTYQRLAHQGRNMAIGDERADTAAALRELIELRRSLADARSRILLLAPVLTFANELCDAIDNAEFDVGGSRSMKEILGELGPAVEAAKR